MTLAYRARVCRVAEFWVAYTFTTGDVETQNPNLHRFAATHGEAMTAAIELVTYQHQKLMDEVHESRAQRRTSKETAA